MNTTPNLVAALALAWAEKNNEMNDHDRKYAELRVYPADRETGYFFVSIRAPARWYWKDEPGADFFNRVEIDDLLADVEKGVRVQLIGDHGRNLGLWVTWDEFERAVSAA